jgi:hypothetical protein
MKIVLKVNLKGIDNSIVNAQADFSPDHPERSANRLREALIEADGLIDGVEKSSLPLIEKSNLLHELRIKRVQLNNALVLTLGLELDVSSSTDSIPTTQGSTTIKTRFTNRGNTSIPFNGIFLQTPSTSPISSQVSFSDKLVAGGSTSENNLDAPLPNNQKATRPYFSRKNTEQPFYDIAIPGLRNAPATPSPLVVTARVWDGVELTLSAIVHAPRDSEHADKTTQPTGIIPPVSIWLNRPTAILRPDEKALEVTATIQSNEGIQKLVDVNLFLQTSTNEKPKLLSTALPQQYNKIIGNYQTIPISVSSSELRGIPATLKAVVTQSHHDYSEGFRPVGYPGLTYTNYYTPAITHIVPVDVTTAPDLNIAYLPGTGDDIPSALDQLGIHPHILTVSDLIPETLRPYDAVILGVRAYEAYPELAAANPALNTYAANGGIVIVQYNTSRLPENTGPYPLSLGDSEKVVEEDAPVQILAPTNPLLTWPNRITTADFDHWIEERGHGFMATWDPHYTALLETHDHGQQPQRGGLLVARTGKGAWIYLGLALYRQLPEGVPGAYRILANLISAAKNTSLQK